ncbi:MAG: hypothetical protein KBA06_03075 [Saprospiraceae bacterium]|nr:hypothetical protein [Saprospiraceae bacterium]
MKYLSYILLRGTINFFGIIPISWLYRLSNVLGILFYYIIPYRKKIIIANLKKSFPEKNEAEILQFTFEYYKYLSKLVVEALKAPTFSEEEMRSRYKVTNPELLQEYYDADRSVVIAGYHYHNWEWAVMALPLWLSHTYIGVGKPLSNKYIDTYFNAIRSRYGMVLANINVIKSEMESRKNDKCAYLFLADQTPADPKRALWLDFLNQPTPFIFGFAKLAKKYDLPIVILTPREVKKGYYEVSFSLLCDNATLMDENDIIRKYASHLSLLIEENPVFWLWSHRRWKHQQ